MGGGTSEIAVISLGGIIASKSIRVAGDDLTEAIVSYIKREFNVLIGTITAEEIKHSIGSAYPSMTIQEMEVTGRDLHYGLPRVVKINSQHVEEAMKEVLMQIINAIKSTLEEIPTELASDIMINGITICGGCALIKNIDRLIALETGIPVNIAKRPLECVANGATMLLDDFDNLKNILLNSKKNRK